MNTTGENNVSVKDEVETVEMQTGYEVHTVNEATPNNSCSSTKVQRRRMTKNVSSKLSTYNKKCLLNFLKTEGSCQFSKALCKLRVVHNEATDFFNKHAKRAEEHVYEECDSLSMLNINQWLELFKSHDLQNQCNYESAVVIKAIANIESFPKPEELAGIDLKSIYEFIGNALLGLPQNALNGNTASFLQSEFELLINEANTAEATEETRNLKQKLQKFKAEQLTLAKRDKLSLDPFMLQSNIE